VSWAVLAALLAAAPCPAADDDLPAATAESICALEARPTQGLDADHARLLDIFSRERFSRARQSSSGAWQALIDRLLAWFNSFFESSGAQSFSQVTRFLVLTLAAVLAVIGVLRLFGRWPGRQRTSAEEAISPTALVLELPGTHLARARAALGKDPREAIRQGLFALLSALEDRRLARPDRVRTNAELVRELPVRGAQAALVAQVGPLVGWYDRAFYSLEPVPLDGATRFVDDVGKLTAELDGRQI
jgi:hypothetical protein